MVIVEHIALRLRKIMAKKQGYCSSVSARLYTADFLNGAWQI